MVGKTKEINNFHFAGENKRKEKFDVCMKVKRMKFKATIKQDYEAKI